MTKKLTFWAATAVALTAVLVISSSVAEATEWPGKGKGRTKVTICHKGKRTIRVGAPAVPAHLRHGDTLGPCGPHPPAHAQTTLTVVKHVVNDNGGTKVPADFTMTINGVTAAGGNSFPGSAAGVEKTLLTTGAYTVIESSVPGYAATMSPGCAGTIKQGEDRVCVITNNDVPAMLTVVKRVINDHFGTKTPADFTITISGVTAVGGNTFAGSSAGVTKVLSSVGAYSVTENAVVGYALQSSSGDCSGTIALGQEKTCVLVNDDV